MARPRNYAGPPRAQRTVFLTADHVKVLNEAALDLAFYTRDRRTLSDVVVLLIEEYLPKLLEDVRSGKVKR